MGTRRRGQETSKRSAVVSMFRSCRPRKVVDGHFQSSDRPENRQANDRFQSTAAVGRSPLEGINSPKPSVAVLQALVDI